MAPRYKVTLTEEERRRLETLTHGGKTAASKFIHARALLLCDAGEHGSPWKVAEGGEALGGDHPATDAEQRSPPLDAAFDARLTALACSPAPAGRARWTVRLLAEKVVELKIAPKVSTMSVQRALKKTSLSLT